MAEVVVAACVAIHLAVSLIGWSNPINEEHGFRQTQTAITSYWIAHGGPILEYQTPVMGPPWSIPMEFPLFQAMVAGVHRISGFGLDACGRAASLAWFYLLLPVAWRLARRLALPSACFAAFGLLYLTSPLYLFWTRAFLMESMAMTLAFAYLALAWESTLGEAGGWQLWVACVLGILAALVKVTTFAGGLGAACVAYALFWWHTRPRASHSARWLLAAAAIPIAVELWWVRFSDAVKLRNPLGFQTSAELTAWNFGAPLFRFSREFWSVLYGRVAHHLLGKMWPLALALALLCLWRAPRALRWIAAVFLVGFWGPTLVFSNLHYVHDYYQFGTAAWLFMGLAVCVGSATAGTERKVAAAALVLVAAGNFWVYTVRYYPSMVRGKDAWMEVARYLSRQPRSQDVIVGYGLDWDSTVPYYSERKAILDRLGRPLNSPEIRESLNGLGPAERIGAVVACTEKQDPHGFSVPPQVAGLGFSEAPVFQNELCQVYTTPDANPKVHPRPGDLALDGIRLEIRSAVPYDVAMSNLPGLGVLAAPDSVLFARLPGAAHRVSVRFGIKDAAWKVYGMGAVEFALETEEGGRRKEVWKRALDPLRQPSDRGEQRAMVEVSGEGICLITRSQDRSVHHRSYWSGIEFMQAAR